MFNSLGIDPAIAVNTILATDMGGFQLAEAVTQDALIGRWAGIVYGSMMGTVIVFSIPVGLAAMKKREISSFSKGILYGIAAIPFGTLAGGLVMGIPIMKLLLNLVPALIFSIIIIVCLSLWPKKTIAVFKGFSIIINVVALLGLWLAIVNDLILIPLAAEGWFDATTIPFFNLLAPTSEGILISGNIGLILAGTLPFVACLSRWLKKPLSKLSKKTGMSDVAIMGFLLSTANNMAMFNTMDKMSDKEVTYNVAFQVGAAFVIGDHLAFTAANAPECTVAMMVGKIVTAILAVTIAIVFTKMKKNKGAMQPLESTQAETNEVVPEQEEVTA